MPPKARLKRLTVDWDWVGKTVRAADEITHEHCRRAAGLHPSALPKPCASELDLPSREPSIVTVISSDSDEISSRKVPRCSPAACRQAPRCYNHMDAKKVRTAPGEGVGKAAVIS